MIDLRKSEIFEGKMAKTIHSFVRRKLSLADLLEELADGFGVQVA